MAQNDRAPPSLTNPTAGIDPYSLDVLGQTGLNRAAGYVYEEKHPKLAGIRAVRAYREMSDNDATVGSVLYVIECLMRQANWRVEPADETPEAIDAKEFLEGCLTDMSHTWEDLIVEILTMLPFGWAWHEIVYKLRIGPDEKEPQYRSRFTDGKYGWRKIPLRGQETWQTWEFDPDGGIRGWWQASPPDYKRVFLPIEKGILFRAKSPKNNPEGRSILRSAFRSWTFVRRLQEIEAIGVERDLTGLPVMFVPERLLASDASVGEKALLASFKDTLVKVRRDEREGVIFPSPRYTDQSGQTIETGFDFKLMTSGGRRQMDVREMITGYQRDIARTMLAEFMFLGETNHGARNVSDNKTTMFAASLAAHLDSIEATFHRYGTERLMEINEFPREIWPRIKHGDVDERNLEVIADYIQKLVLSGALTPDAKLERHLRDVARFPEPEDGDADTKPPPQLPPKKNGAMDGQPPAAAREPNRPENLKNNQDGIDRDEED